MAHEGIDHHATTGEWRLGDDARRDVCGADNGDEGKLRAHVQAELVCGKAVGRGLREDVYIGDLKVADKSEIHYFDELEDNLGGFRELFKKKWDIAAVRQVVRGGDVELTAVLGECVEVLLGKRVDKACPTLNELAPPCCAIGV